MKKKIDHILEGIGGWICFIFMIVVLIPLVFVAKILELTGCIIRVNFIRRCGLLTGVGVAYMFLKIIDIAFEVGVYGELRKKLEDLQNGYRKYIESVKEEF